MPPMGHTKHFVALGDVRSRSAFAVHVIAVVMKGWPV
jgi:hypothetical protein